MSHGWKRSTTPPKFFKPEYPIFSKSYDRVMILGSFNKICITSYILGCEGNANYMLDINKIVLFLLLTQLNLYRIYYKKN